MKPATRRIGTGLTFMAVAMLAGCALSQPTQFYTLSGIETAEALSIDQPMRLGVGPVYLPAYLDRPQVVTRSGANRMNVSEFDQWAEPLETTFQRVLSENLSNRLSTDRVATLPARRDVPLDHQVEVEVTRFDADETGKIILDARWRIFDGRGDRLLHRGRSVTEERITTAGDHEEIAAAMSRCLAAMSDEVAEALVAH